ncbi:ABC transporter permease, partial [Mesorhizobium sp. M7A.F.Ca.US.001.02.1.1]
MSTIQTTSSTPDDTRPRGPLAEVFFSLLRSRTFLVGFAIVLFWVA